MSACCALAESRRRSIAAGDAIASFQLRRMRSGIETLLDANQVIKEIRGQLQSHGLTTVQGRHYKAPRGAVCFRRPIRSANKVFHRRVRR